jgi:predicted lipase
MITGHSLGGAIAALAALDIVLSGVARKENLELYTFGEPRVGNTDFANAMDLHVP